MNSLNYVLHENYKMLPSPLASHEIQLQYITNETYRKLFLENNRKYCKKMAKMKTLLQLTTCLSDPPWWLRRVWNWAPTSLLCAVLHFLRQTLSSFPLDPGQQLCPDSTTNLYPDPRPLTPAHTHCRMDTGSVLPNTIRLWRRRWSTSSNPLNRNA